VRTSLPILIIVAASSCATQPEGTYVWVNDYTAPVTTPSTAIAPGDLLDVRVLGQEQLSAKVRVGRDGRITLPFLSNMAAAGRTADDLGEEIRNGLKQFVNSPIVTVGVEKAPPDPVLIMGEVARPGQQQCEPGTRLLDGLAMAGGLTEYAHKDRVFVLRGSPTRTRIRFDFREMIRGEGPGVAFELLPGDIVVVE
jgi:polysaccharide export outer membrane protein